MTKSYVKVQRKLERDAHAALHNSEAEKSVDTNSESEPKPEKKVTKRKKKDE